MYPRKIPILTKSLYHYNTMKINCLIYKTSIDYIDKMPISNTFIHIFPFYWYL
jgi:hypothetical protein